MTARLYKPLPPRIATLRLLTLGKSSTEYASPSSKELFATRFATNLLNLRTIRSRLVGLQSRSSLEDNANLDTYRTISGVGAFAIYTKQAK